MAGPKPNDVIVDYPHPSILLDTVLVERTSNKLGNYAPIEPGAPFDKTTHTAAQSRDFEGNIFLGQKATADDEWMEQHWGKEPSTQDIANWEEGYAEESNSHPVFSRRYLEKRDSYTPRTKAAVLPGLYRINVTAPGNGFTSVPTVVFTGGTGSGASAIAVLDNNGGIAKVVLKAEGTYTAVPTISFSGGGGSGATATASVQGAACLLVAEKATDEAPFPYNSLYLLVQRIYETLPGPIITTTRIGDDGSVITMTKQKMLTGSVVSSEVIVGGTYTKYWKGEGNSVWAYQMTESMSTTGNEVIMPGYEDETGAATRTVIQRQALSVAVNALGTTRIFDGITMYLWDVKGGPIDSDLMRNNIEEWMALPDTYTERPSRGFQFPAMFEYITGWATDYDGIYDPPWPGVNFTLSAHRTASKPMTATHTFSVGVPGTMPDTWTVTTPGKASKIFPTIGDNTIHNDWIVTETTATLTDNVVEDVPDSTPNSYDPTDELTVEADAKRWNTVFWKKTVLTTTEVEP